MHTIFKNTTNKKAGKHYTTRSMLGWELFGKGWSVMGWRWVPWVARWWLPISPH